VKAAQRSLTEIARLTEWFPPLGGAPCNRLASAHGFFLKNKLDDCLSEIKSYAHTLLNEPTQTSLQNFFSSLLQTFSIFIQYSQPRPFSFPIR
jgi:hypothetical protein